VLLVCGPGFATVAHQHHCVQLLMALHGSLLVRGGRNRAWRKCGAVWVRPDAIHQMDARGSKLLIGFISAESDLGAALAERIEGEIACAPNAGCPSFSRLVAVRLRSTPVSSACWRTLASHGLLLTVSL
jgi:hypothetical protein